ncbi:hypothetical protein, partial [Pseudomonas sp. SWRI154]|uniref:hypothetical protein n=1 Tax=Pseudomonas sp. SWRI154 TaxID=2745501 RepID=UPI001EE15545
HLAEWFWVCCAAQREQAPSPQVYRLLSKAAFACASEDQRTFVAMPAHPPLLRANPYSQKKRDPNQNQVGPKAASRRTLISAPR